MTDDTDYDAAVEGASLEQLLIFRDELARIKGIKESGNRRILAYMLIRPARPLPWLSDAMNTFLAKVMRRTLDEMPAWNGSPWASSVIRIATEGR